MNVVIFGLTISSSWGNGHATLWRGLCKALGRDGHHVTFFERDLPYYAMNRDFYEIPGGELVFYSDWADVRQTATRALADADVTIVTSYCPDAVAASALMLSHSRALNVFYDLDTPITLSHLQRGDAVPYLSERELRDFDLVLSYTGGAALDALRTKLGARRVAPLYGHVDPDTHRPCPPATHYRCDLSYMGTFSADRQNGLVAFLVDSARARPQLRFLIGGAQYPQDFPWNPNIYFVRHLPPDEHSAFFCSSRLTLNVTRKPMAEMGWCPSGRLFEAAATGTAVLSDEWEGLHAFFTPGEEVFVARDHEDALAILDLPEEEIRRVARAAKERTLDEHTSAHRARELIGLLERARRPAPQMAGA
ncbi:MAG TPA: glycosyltransferase [Xanthobacteraceae bacterium]|nr:glycosyltransferase [Xanthobacteraceae bacterium]